MPNKISGAALLLLAGIAVHAQKERSIGLNSPDGKINVKIADGPKLGWSVSCLSQQVLAPSELALYPDNGEVWGQEKARPSVSKEEHGNAKFATPFYKKDSVTDRYNQITLRWKDHGIVFRAYNDGAAYRWFSFAPDAGVPLTIRWEKAEFNFDKDYPAYLPYVRDLRVPGDQHNNSFEALYDEANLSATFKDSLAFLPVLIDLQNGMKAVVTEADLENYPGMCVKKNTENDHSLIGDFAGYPAGEKAGGYENINTVVTERAPYIARTRGTVEFPWRIVIVSKEDKELTNNDMVQRLGAPSRISDISWIKPGKVSWDWWNDWNISHVDFRAGINTLTYKYYIDFAAANKLDYIIMDEGWSDRSDLMALKPNIDLQEIIDYGKQKNVGVILWATWSASFRQMDVAFPKYAAMGVRGFKIDFLDRDDQKMTGSTYTIAQKAAENKLMVDLHGMYKPDGLQRTYPNVVNFEGVKGLENVKWTPHDDVPHYDVTIPFIRMVAGPMDYTPGATRNSIKSEFHPSHSMPMSQGTRCHQLAMYVVFEAPLEMLADNPTAYMREQESTNFIAGIPTVFDETVALDGKIGQYVAIARRKGSDWFVGAMSNWDDRDLTIDLSFLPAGKYTVESFQDGINADHDATDYKRSVAAASSGDKLTVHLSNGGGWAAKITPAP